MPLLPPDRFRPMPPLVVVLCALIAASCSGDDNGTGVPNPTVVVAASVTISPSAVALIVPDSVQLTAVVRDGNGIVMPNATVSWSVGNSQTASVSANGMLRALQAGGTTVTAASAPASGQVNVTIGSPTSNAPYRPNLMTYLGGNDSDMPRDVTVDASGNVVVVGNAASTNFPVTAGAYDQTRDSGFNPPSDAFISTFTPGGTLLWSTYLGGPGYERAYSVETDAQGFVYVGGRAGAGFPVTAGAFQTTFGGGSTSNFYGPQDAFVCKLLPNGSARVWCSYFGVGDDGIARDLAIDAQGNVYVVAWTNTGGFPAAWFTNAYQRTKAAGFDVVVAKIKADGSQVLWATYLGGAGDDSGTPAIRVDPSGNVLVLFATTSTNLPTPNGADATLGGAGDQFLAKLSPDGSTLLYGTYIGGNGLEASETHGLAVDPQGNAVVVVATSSTNLATTPGAYQSQYGGGPFDVGIWKVSPTGQFLAVSYYGGAASDAIQGVSTDAQGSIFFSATTESANIPLTVPRGVGGGEDVVAVKLSGDATRLMFAQRFGGSGDDVARASWFGPLNQFVLVGQTDSPNFPLLNAPFTRVGGSLDAFVVRLIP